MLCVREETGETSESTHRNLTKANGELEGVQVIVLEINVKIGSPC